MLVDRIQANQLDKKKIKNSSRKPLKMRKPWELRLLQFFIIIIIIIIIIIRSLLCFPAKGPVKVT